MSAPVFICLTSTGAHLAYGRGEVALCGKDVRGCPSYALEPGADVGEAPEDCKRCVREWRDDTKAARK